MSRSDCFRLERQLAGRASHPLGHSAFPRRTKILKLVPLIGGPGPAPPRFEAVETVARGGVLTALPALLQAGLLSDRDRLGPVAGYYGQRAVLLLQAFLLLARVRNPERLRYEQPGEWGRLLGLDRSCAPDTLRRKLGELAGGEDAVQAWREQLARQWVSAAADDVATLFVDGHVQVYHGQANLPSTSCRGTG